MSKKILFQGDSITDCNRGNGLGTGYANLVAATLGFQNPQKYEFINRGISGNDIVNLYARIKSDFINLNPDYASIFIGINDVAHEICNNNGVATEKFEKIYDMMICEILEACPQIKIIIIPPVVLEGVSTCNTDALPNRFSQFEEDTAKKAEVCRKIAFKYGFPFIELQSAFNEMCQKADSSYWSIDGIHPTTFGHEMIKKKWLEAFELIK
ncbi:MAG: hypothetical protein IJA34_10810 [Lachnospiraceae bacterium]|nr:hypothetical protein [Lachnospiraceae bacterium]